MDVAAQARESLDLPPGSTSLGIQCVRGRPASRVPVAVGVAPLVGVVAASCVPVVVVPYVVLLEVVSGLVLRSTDLLVHE